jgi:hypothetical protein
MVAGRARRDEDVRDIAGKDVVDRRIGRADGVQRRFVALRADAGVGVDARDAVSGICAMTRSIWLFRMRVADRFRIAFRRVEPVERVEGLVGKRFPHRPDPVRAFRMAGRGDGVRGRCRANRDGWSWPAI